MPKAVKDLTSDQLRRIFRDYLKGVPKERLIQKYDIPEGTFWEIVGLYSKKKHPNDVGNAQDILGPADPLVSPLDTGSTATEHPIVARNPKDLNVSRERVVEEFDYNSPEEELRKKGGDVGDLVAKRNADKAKKERDEAKEVIKVNLEETDAILEELAEVSTSEAEKAASEAAEAAKAIPPPEEIALKARELREATLVADAASEAARLKAARKHAEENRERDQEAVEAGEEQNQKLVEEEQAARQKETEERAADAKNLRKEAARAAEELAELGRRGSESAGSDRPAPSNQGDRPGEGTGAGAGEGKVAPTPVVPVANTSKTAQPDAVQPAKVEPGKLKGK